MKDAIPRFIVFVDGPAKGRVMKHTIAPCFRFAVPPPEPLLTLFNNPIIEEDLSIETVDYMEAGRCDYFFNIPLLPDKILILFYSSFPSDNKNWDEAHSKSYAILNKGYYVPQIMKMLEMI